jgi:hypothetical protein
MSEDSNTKINIFSRWVNKFSDLNNDASQENRPKLGGRSLFSFNNSYEKIKSFLSIINNENLDSVEQDTIEGSVSGSTKKLFNLQEFNDYSNDQRAGILRTSGSTTRTAEFNISREYNKENGDLEFLANTEIERNQENISNVVGNAAGSLDKLFKLNDNTTYLADQQAGILKGSDGTTRTADFNHIRVYPSNVSNDQSNLKELWNGGSIRRRYINERTEPRNNVYGPGISEYGLLSNPIQQRDFDLSDFGGPTIRVYDNEKSRLFEKRLRHTKKYGFGGYASSFKDFDDFFNAVDEVQSAGIFVDSNADRKDLLREWLFLLGNVETNSYTGDIVGGGKDARKNETNKTTVDYNKNNEYEGGYLSNLNSIVNEGLANSSDANYAKDQRDGVLRSGTETRTAFFNANNKYEKTKALFNSTATEDINVINNTDRRISSEEQLRINDILKANQEGYGVSARSEVALSNTFSFFQNFNNDRQYQLSDTNNNTFSNILKTALFDNEGNFNTNFSSRRKIQNVLTKWFRESNKVLAGRRITLREGVDHLVKNYRISPSTVNPRSSNNIYSGSSYGPQDYMLMFYSSLESWTSSPEESDITSSARKGYNVGQIGGSKDFKLKEPQYRPALTNFDNAFNDFVRTLSIDGSTDIDALIDEAKIKLVELYRPGLNRINQPFRIPASLDDYLNQNTLLPKETPSDYKSPESVFSELYVNNRTKDFISDLVEKANKENPETIQDETVFAKGIIAGVPLVEIERDGTLRSNPAQTPKVFTFLDDLKNLKYEAKIQGFVNNIPGSVKALQPTIQGGVTDTSDIGSELPSVVQHNVNGFQNKILNRQQKGDEQYFPFLFETENRRRGSEAREQMCYFQATLDNISEAYNPAWQNKHFFGRTEQVSTYTYTERTINISFSIVANSSRQLQNLHERVNWLAQQTYGQYNITGGQSIKMGVGPLIRMTIGDMFSGLGGFIQSLSYDWNFLGAGGKWEMTQGIRIPMACKVSLGFKVLHDDLPDRNYNLYAGPLQREDGLIRGNDGPLIKTSNRQTATGGVQGENEQYIDYMARNISIGND